jgi:predicted transcriptional regulator
MADVTLTVSEELMARLNALAQAAGHSSGEEFARAILQREIERLDASDSDQKIEDRLRGLGYIS